MLEKVLALFQGDTTETDLASADRIPLALAVLMLELSYADGLFDTAEFDVMLNHLMRQFELSPSAADELIDLARQKRDQSVDLYAFTREINWNFSQEEKQDIAQGLWGLVLADGTISPEEGALMRQISHLIGLTHARMIEAKLRAKDNTPSTEQTR